MEVGHRHAEDAVGAADDVRIADAFLLGDLLAVDEGQAVVERGEAVAVGAERHVQAVRVVFEIDEQVGAELGFLGQAGGDAAGGEEGGNDEEQK